MPSEAARSSIRWNARSMAGLRGRVTLVAIYRLLQNSAFGPGDIDRMTAAYEDALPHSPACKTVGPDY